MIRRTLSQLSFNFLSIFLPYTVKLFRERRNKIIEVLELNPEHRPHDPRKQFVTICKKYKVDEYTIKRIVGHAIDDITEKIYTDRDKNWLINEVKKIKR